MRLDCVNFFNVPLMQLSFFAHRHFE